MSRQPSRTMASRTSLYRKRMRENDPAKYEAYLEAQRERARARTKASKEEPLTSAKLLDLKRRRENIRMYQAKYRARLREEQGLPCRSWSVFEEKRPSAHVKDMTPKELRAYNAGLKAKSRSRYSEEKKQKCREQAKMYMRQKRQDSILLRQQARLNSTTKPGPKSSTCMNKSKINRSHQARKKQSKLHVSQSPSHNRQSSAHRGQSDVSRTKSPAHRKQPQTQRAYSSAYREQSPTLYTHSPAHRSRVMASALPSVQPPPPYSLDLGSMGLDGPLSTTDTLYSLCDANVWSSLNGILKRPSPVDGTLILEGLANAAMRINGGFVHCPARAANRKFRRNILHARPRRTVLSAMASSLLKKARKMRQEKSAATIKLFYLMPTLLSVLCHKAVTMAQRAASSYASGTHSMAFVTVPNADVAKTLAGKLVKERLAACVNIIPQVTSVYEWEGKIEEDNELILMIKTATSKVDELSSFVRENHPYDCPEVISAKIDNGNPAYLDWISQIVQGSKVSSNESPNQ